MEIHNRPTLKRLVERDGIDKLPVIMSNLIERKSIDPQEISLRELAEACGAEMSIRHNTIEFREEVGSKAFSVITSALINKMVIKGYETEVLPIDVLCTNMPSSLPDENVAGFTEPEDPEEIAPLHDYPDSSITDRYVKTGEDVKVGRIISISKEAILFDQTGQLTARAEKLGQRCQHYKFKKIIDGITDTNSDVYYPSGIQTALYAAGNTVPSNALVDWTDLDGAEAELDGQTDDQGHRIEMGEGDRVLLVPSTLKATASRIVSAIQLNKKATNEETIFSNPYAKLKNVASAYLDSISTSTWYYGLFKEAFWWKDTIPLTTSRREKGSDDEFKRDIVFQFKVSFRGKLFAVSNKYVIKNTA